MCIDWKGSYFPILLLHPAYRTSRMVYIMVLFISTAPITRLRIHLEISRDTLRRNPSPLTFHIWLVYIILVAVFHWVNTRSMLNGHGKVKTCYKFCYLSPSLVIALAFLLNIYAS